MLRLDDVKSAYGEILWKDGSAMRAIPSIFMEDLVYMIKVLFACHGRKVAVRWNSFELGGL